MGSVTIPQVEVTPRRLALFAITPELLVELFKAMHEPMTLSCEGVPKDAVVVGATFDHERRTFVLQLESDAFRPCYPETTLPYIEPRMTRHY